MRRRIFMGLTFAALIFFMFLNEPRQENVSYEKKFVFVCPKQWDWMAEGIWAADEAFNTNTKCYCTVSPDVGRQANQIRAALNWGVDGIITAGTKNTEELLEVLQEADKRGIPVVLVDSDLPESGRLTYIGVDNKEAGRLAAENMGNASGYQAKIAVIITGVDNLNQMERLEGFKKVINKYPDMEICEILSCNSEEKIINREVAALIADHPEINAIFCAEGASTRLLGNLLDHMEISKEAMTVIGFDAKDFVTEYLENGRYYASIVQQLYAMGYQAVQTLVEFGEGKEIEEINYIQPIELRSDTISVLETETTEKGAGREWYLY